MSELEELFNIALYGAAILGNREEFLWVRGYAVHIFVRCRSSLLLRKDSQTQREMLNGDVLISSQMNSRKQVSNRYDDTLEGEEQIRQIVSFQVQEIVDGDRRGVLEQEDVSERRTEDEEETLRMTQKVSNQYNLDNNNQMEWCESPTMSRRDWTKKCSGAGVYEG